MHIQLLFILYKRFRLIQKFEEDQPSRKSTPRVPTMLFKKAYQTVNIPLQIHKASQNWATTAGQDLLIIDVILWCLRMSLSIRRLFQGSVSPADDLTDPLCTSLPKDKLGSWSQVLRPLQELEAHCRPVAWSQQLWRHCNHLGCLQI